MAKEMMKLQAPEKEVLNPQLAKDLEAILLAEEELNAIREKIKKLAAMLSTMKNPLLGIQEIMGAVMNESGAQIACLSAVDNLDSDLRSQITTAQNDFNDIPDQSPATKGKDNPKWAKEAKQMYEIIQALQAFINEQFGKGKNAVADAAALKNMQQALNTIKDAFGNDWGNFHKMGLDIWNWNHAVIKEKKLKDLQNGFATFNQSVSALSTVTNTKLNFVVEQFKQIMGMFESDNQMILKLGMTEVSNQRTS